MKLDFVCCFLVVAKTKLSTCLLPNINPPRGALFNKMCIETFSYKHLLNQLLVLGQTPMRFKIFIISTLPYLFMYCSYNHNWNGYMCMYLKIPKRGVCLKTLLLILTIFQLFKTLISSCVYKFIKMCRSIYIIH